ncbi:MAG: DNA replication/repair protein RecF [Bacilli bacterium]
MILKKLLLQNFRNYKKIEIDFFKNINIFYGNNAQGKTNILEAIYILALTKSFRTQFDNEILKFDSNSSKITGMFEKDEMSIKLEVIISKDGKRVKKNNKVIKKFSNYISNLNIIIFCPDDLKIIRGTPNDRRKFLNIEIGQLDNKYITILNNYNALLKNRNEYLRNLYVNKSRDHRYLEVLTDKLIDLALKIYEFRKKFILLINKEIKKIQSELLEKEIRIEYRSFMDILSCDSKKTKEELTVQFKKDIEREIFYGSTLVGPHKDDLIFFIDNKEIKKYGSQGQQRAMVLALKLAEINVFYKEKKNYPILLLDDVLSEIDEEKKNIFLKKIKRKIQTIITTTNLKDISDDVLKKSRIYYIENASIIKTDRVV